MLKKILDAASGGREIILIVLFALGGLLLFCGVVNFKHINDPDTWSIRSSPLILLIVVGIILIATTMVILYLTKEKQKQRLPDISGYWHYHIKDAANKPSHTGNCTITFDAGVAKFVGTRRFVVEERTGKLGSIEINWPWETTWTDYGTDGWFRCEYKFKSFNGYFKIRFSDRESSKNEFEGTYYLLPDSFENGKLPPNALYGTVKFQRVLENKYTEVRPPVGAEVWPN